MTTGSGPCIPALSFPGTFQNHKNEHKPRLALCQARDRLMCDGAQGRPSLMTSFLVDLANQET